MENVRPSVHELDKKICFLRESCKNKKIFPVHDTKLKNELKELNIYFNNFYKSLYKISFELKPEYYTGHRPPEKSTKEEKIKNAEMFAFSWESEELQEKVYIKFAIKNNQCFLVSLHKDRPRL